MESIKFFKIFVTAMTPFFLLFVWKLVHSCLIFPNQTYRKLKKDGFRGPTPNFPLGNTKEMITKPTESLSVFHDIHSFVFPYFARWQKSHGKVFIYWLGVEPFLYIADPEFLRKMSSGVLGKSWGKPAVFREDRLPMFGNGLVMAEGEHWIHHRHVITPAFSPANLKAMTSQMVESTTKMLDRWDALYTSGKPEIDVEHDIISTAGEIIAKVSFGKSDGTSYKNGQIVFEKLRTMQMTLFKSNRYVGVPFSKFLSPKKSLEARRLGKEIDQLFLSIINLRKESRTRSPEQDLLGLLLAGNNEKSRLGGKTLTSRELIDECKTFFFGGHETTALSISWTLLLLAVHPEWQTQLREEIKQVIGDGEIDSTKLAALKKMGWVWNEVLRLYSPAPNVQRQAREGIQVDDMVIPKGINMWIDVVGMNHDKELWGDDVFEFKPERFKDDLYGGCKHKMGFLPFGFGGRMCVGRNLSAMEYKVVLTLILSRFSLSVSPNYRHSPAIMLSLRPRHGLPLMVQPL